MRYFRGRSDNPNALAAIFLLVLLAVFAGPNTLPRLLSSVVPTADEGVPCDWLRLGTERAEHQSLIGRSVTNPLALGIRSSAVPNTPDGVLSISVTVVNQSIGTIPIVYNRDRVLIGDNGTNGLGIIFEPAVSLTTGAVRQDSASIPESDIRLLGPRQRCVHRLEFPANRLDPNFATGSVRVRAYYRNTTRGQVVQSGSPATPIFTDQGLWTGFIQSEAVIIPLASQ
jgi:hypothetical protein